MAVSQARDDGTESRVNSALADLWWARPIPSKAHRSLHPGPPWGPSSRSISGIRGTSHSQSLGSDLQSLERQIKRQLDDWDIPKNCSVLHSSLNQSHNREAVILLWIMKKIPLSPRNTPFYPFIDLKEWAALQRS